MWRHGTFTCTCAHTSCYFEDVSPHAGGGVGWGGVGWGGVLTFTHLRTAMMWRHGTFTCTCAHTSCYFEDVSPHAGGGVGWGGVLTFTLLRTTMMWRHGTFTCSCAHTSCYVEEVSRHAGGGGGVGWGINVHSLAHRYDVTPRHVHLHLRTYVMLLWRCFTSRRGWGGVGWGGVLTFTHLRTAMMWRHGTFTCTCAHTSCYFEDVSPHAGGGVGWGGVGY